MPIRQDIQNEKNTEYVKILATAFCKGLSNVKMVNGLLNMEPELKRHLLPRNSEIYDVKKEDIAFIENTLYRVQAKLQEKDYKTAYDIVDMLHVFPQVILSGDKKKREEYWKVYVKHL